MFYTTIKSNINIGLKKILCKMFGYIIEMLCFKNLLFALKINLENKQRCMISFKNNIIF